MLGARAPISTCLVSSPLPAWCPELWNAPIIRWCSADCRWAADDGREKVYLLSLSLLANHRLDHYMLKHIRYSSRLHRRYFIRVLMYSIVAKLTRRGIFVIYGFLWQFRHKGCKPPHPHVFHRCTQKWYICNKVPFAEQILTVITYLQSWVSNHLLFTQKM